MRHKGYAELRLDALTAFPGNPRRGDVETITRSLLRFGQYRSVVVWQVPLSDGGLDENVVVAGNHTSAAATLLSRMTVDEAAKRFGERWRARAAEWAGQETIRAELIEPDDWDEARRINGTDNRLAELGGYDDRDLAEMLASYGDDFEGSGWVPEDLTALREEPGRPVEFRAYDEDLPVEHVCPRCGYGWSGSPDPSGRAPAAEGDAGRQIPSSGWDGS